MKRASEEIGDANPKRRRLNVRTWISSSFLGLLFAVLLDRFYFSPTPLYFPPLPIPAKIKSFDWNYTRYKEANAVKTEIAPEWVLRCIATFNEKRLFESQLNESYVLHKLQTRDSYTIHPSKFSVQTLNHDDFSIRIIDCYLL